MWKRPENETSEAETKEPSRPPAPAASRAPAKPGGTPAGIGPSITIRGELRGQEDLVVQGTIEGKIDLAGHQVRVGQQGRVKADIHGSVIAVEGHVEGHLYGLEQVVVHQTGVVLGDITSPRVSLEDGAQFKGSIDMEPKGGAPNLAAKAEASAKGGGSDQKGGGPRPAQSGHETGPPHRQKNRG